MNKRNVIIGIIALIVVIIAVVVVVFVSNKDVEENIEKNIDEIYAEQNLKKADDVDRQETNDIPLAPDPNPNPEQVEE